MDLLTNQIRPTLCFLAGFFVLFGFIYPGITTVILHFAVPEKANGSLITIDGKMRGSTLLGQSFSSTHYFWGRPSSTVSFPYNTTASAGSNLSVNNPSLINRVKKDVTLYHQTSLVSLEKNIPIDLITASASGLDPHISLAGAEYQIPRVAHSRGLPESMVANYVKQNTENRMFTLLGEPRVHVLKLNQQLDALKNGTH